MRSATAQMIFHDDPRFEVKSAGTDATANVVLSEDVLSWADTVIVMEKHHRNAIRKRFPEIYASKRIVCLYIEDNYDYMQPDLILILKERVESALRRGLL